MATRVWVLLALVAIAACDKKSKDGASTPGTPDAAAADKPVAAADGGPKLGELAQSIVADPTKPEPPVVAVAAPDAGAAEPPVAVVVVDAGAAPEVADPVVADAVDAGAGAGTGTGSGTAVAVAAPLKAGDKISAKWSDGYWYPAKISKVNDNGTFDIKYDDGTKVKSQPAKKVKPRKAKTGGGKSSGGGCSGGRTKCGGRCVDLQNDPNNCWSCGRQCPEACMGASCVSNAYKYGS
jgi:hypothetical protein